MKWHQMTTKGRARPSAELLSRSGKVTNMAEGVMEKRSHPGSDLASRDDAGGVNLRLGVAAGPPDGG